MTALGYTVKKLDQMKDAPIPEQHRLARIIRKNSARDANGLPSQGCFVPALECADDYYADVVINAAIVNFLQDTQDKMIRKIADSGRNIITDSDLDPVAMRAFLEETDDSIGRLSKDKIVAWFTTEVQDSLMLAFADRLGIGDTPTPEQQTKLEQTLAGYRDCFAQMASKNPTVEERVGVNLLKALDMIPASAFSLRMSEVVTKAMHQPQVDLLAL